MINKIEHLSALSALQKNEFSARVDDLNALRAEFGPRVEEIVAENRAKKIEANWRKIAEAHGRNDIQGMKEVGEGPLLWKNRRE